MDKQFCQSCSMPLTDEVKGTEKNGSKSEDYCSYCYKDGAFTSEMSMQDMIDFCAPMMAQGGTMTEDEARQQMQGFFPQLKRWQQA